MKPKILLIASLLINSFLAAMAQQDQVVSGTVTDAITGDPLPGVNVIIEATVTGSTTGPDGKYTLPKPVIGSVITFSFIGYTTEKVTYSGQSVIDVKLSQTVRELDQVVVIGYGVIKKSDLTGSVASVGSKEIQKSIPVNVESALQGRVAGMMITSNSGAPGSEPVIRIRGIGTINNNDPVFVVDGVIVDNTSFYQGTRIISFLNPWDIESVEVLKDASAQAIYGSRGANGVILITTKKGSEGLPKVTFSTTVGLNRVTRIPEVLSPEEYRHYVYMTHYNGYLRSMPDADISVPPDTLYAMYPFLNEMVKQYDKGYRTNWMDEILKKNSISQNYNLTVEGGTKYARYMANAGYLYSDGIVRNFNYKRYSFRVNTDFKAGNFLTIGENLGISSAAKNGLDNSGSYNDAFTTPPLTPVLKPDGSADTGDPDWEYNKYEPGIGFSANPVLTRELEKHKSHDLTIVGNIFTEASVLKNLKFRSSIGINLAYKDLSNFEPRYYHTSLFQNQISTLCQNTYRTNGWTFENTMTWSKIIKNHSITAMAGYTTEYSKTTYQFATKRETPRNYPEMQTFDAATSGSVLTGTYNELSMISYLGRVNYSFHDKYLMTASVRRDGSSKFAPGHRWGIFPSFSLGWKISEEKFLKDRGTKFISNLKLRAGWGQIGNTSILTNYGYVSQVSSTKTDGYIDNRYIFGERVYTGYTINQVGNPDISWETTEQTNIGLDIGILDNTLSVSADFYIKNTKDMLIQLPLIFYSGYPFGGRPSENIGTVQNKGFEITAEYRGKSGEFMYNISLNAATFKNKVLSLSKQNEVIQFGFNRTVVGKPLGEYYGYKTNGVFQNEYAVKSYVSPGGEMIQPNAMPGDLRFQNLYFDNVLDIRDQTWIGTPWPKLTYGLNLNLVYKAIDLVAFLQGSYGNDIVNTGLYQGLREPGYGNIFKYIYDIAWKGPFTSDSFPVLTTVEQNDNIRNSDLLIESGSYLRLKNLQVGYNLPRKLCDKLRISGGRFWIGGTNLITITRYRGIDPEVGTDTGPNYLQGHDLRNTYPKIRELTIGISVTI